MAFRKFIILHQNIFKRSIQRFLGKSHRTVIMRDCIKNLLVSLEFVHVEPVQLINPVENSFTHHLLQEAFAGGSKFALGQNYIIFSRIFVDPPSGYLKLFIPLTEQCIDHKGETAVQMRYPLIDIHTRFNDGIDCMQVVTAYLRNKWQ